MYLQKIYDFQILQNIQIFFFKKLFHILNTLQIWHKISH